MLFLLALKSFISSAAGGALDAYSSMSTTAKVVTIATILLGASNAGTYVYVHHNVVAQYTTKLTDQKAAYEKILADERVRQATAVATQQRETTTMLAGLHEQILTAQAQKQIIIKTIIQKVPEYVTKYADAHCTIPTGFVWGYNASLSPESGVPESRPSDVDSASGVKLSEVAAVAESNNAECVERGKIIYFWQKWYADSKSIFDHAKAITVPPPNTPE